MDYHPLECEAEACRPMQIGPGILRQTAEAYRKLRGTLRFLLGNLADFDPVTQVRVEGGAARGWQGQHGDALGSTGVVEVIKGASDYLLPCYCYCYCYCYCH